MPRAKITVHRDAGHPWDARPGFDVIMIDAPDQATMNAAVASCERKFWHPWLIGFDDNTRLPGGVLYKPCGIKEPWHDSPERPHPGNPRRAAPAAG